MIAALEAAAETNGYTASDGLCATRASIRSGLRGGRKNPRAVPEPKARESASAEDAFEWFWELTSTLRHVRDFAYARLVGPWAVLGVALARGGGRRPADRAASAVGLRQRLPQPVRRPGRGIFGLMADAENPDSAATRDFTRFPSGEREWSEFINRVAASGDVAERHFIELKSDIDPTNKEGAAKVAKFILGAANRDPERAKKYLEGHAVMILGVSEGNARGLERFEAKDFVGAVQPYVGDPGPRWDFHRIRVDDDRDVIVVTVVPPQAGDPPWPCCREGVGLIDGRIYIRADGETREAKSGEVRALLARASAAAGPRPDLTVALSRSVRQFHCDSSVFNDYLSRERQRLEACALAPPQSTPAPPAPRMSSAADYLSAASMTSSIGDMFSRATTPDPRSREEYLAEIDQWEQKAKSARRRFASEFAFAITPPTHIEACSQSYLEEVKIKIRLDGPVRARPKPAGPADFHDLPSPPRPWGPQSIFPSSLIDPADYPIGLTNMATHTAPPLYRRYDNIDINNSDSVNLTVLVEELRPQETYISGDELILYVPVDYDESIVVGTWTATAKNHHQQYSGELQIEIETTDITEPLREYLRIEASETDETT